MQLFPQHNGIVEMENMHIVEITHAMLNEFFLLDYFKVETIMSQPYFGQVWG
jgi:hypothetical protein